MTKSSRITAAYAKLSPEIGSICETIRSLIHKTAPSVTENWKWGPCFEKNGIVMGLWGFKKHVSFVFYRGSEMSDRHKLFNDGFDNAHNRMIKFTSLKELKAKHLSDYIREAVKLNESSRKESTKAVKTVIVPDDLSAWLKKNRKAHTFYESLAFTHKKELVQLLSSAKQEATRERRFKKITEALKSGKKTIS